LLDGKPIRVSTTIHNPDGTRNIGSELLGPARGAIDAGKSFVGINPVGDRPFISRYDFLRDANGNDVGVLASEIPLVLRDVAAARIMRAVFNRYARRAHHLLGSAFFS
jgi:Cache 3/Cache 2 fusion domain